MTNEEIIKEIQQGKNKAENMGNLYTTLKPFTIMIIKRTLKRAVLDDDMLDDLMQTCYFAFDKAVERFDSSKGYKFTSYYSKYIMGYVKRYGINSMSMFRGQIISSDVPIGESNENINIIDCIADKEPTPLERAEKNDLVRVWEICERKLSERDNKILVDNFKQKKTYISIAEEQGCSFQNVRSIVEKSLKTLRHDKDIRIIGEDWGYFSRNVGVAEFNRTWTSSVELSVLSKEQILDRLTLQRKEELQELRHKIQRGRMQNGKYKYSKM